MPLFQPPDKNASFPQSEASWLAFWKEHDVFGRQLEQSAARCAAEGKTPYVFMEGPPTANGLPHPGHVLTRVAKDVFLRFRSMLGHDVQRKAGWDTHGLPVEIEIEKELGLQGKKAIEEYGLEGFIDKCRDSVFQNAEVWTRMTSRLGFWIDMDHPYVTYHGEFVESVWWSLKRLWEAGLLYRGHKVLPWCPRCGTALSSHEVGQGYREVSDPSAYVAFRSKNDADLRFLAWTTTPWTLLSNAALAVRPDADYDYVRLEDKTLVMASARREAILGQGRGDVLQTVKGRALAGMLYEPLYAYAPTEQTEWKVVADDFVGLETGSGIVHMAPAFGDDDFRICMNHGIPLVNPVLPDGRFDETIAPWAGKFVKDADPLILKDLRQRGALIKSETYKHDYPYCWRCPSPLLYYPRPAWFIRTSAFKDEMLKNSELVQWHPRHVGEGRFKNFLENNVDWALSRERYWGTPLPIWTCECGSQEAIGGLAELRARAGTDVWEAEAAQKSGSADGHILLHKPHIDRLTFACPDCGGTMKRVSEVIDCWYDSGAVPFAQWGYPHREGSAEKLAAAFPADFITEAIDQTRGWFYSLVAIATLLRQCARMRSEKNEPLGDLAPFARDYPLPFRHCLVLGHILTQDGQKLSKSLKNYEPPESILDSEGSDAMRWFFYVSNQPWTSSRFFQAAIRETQRDFLIRLRNVYSFFAIYAEIDGFSPRSNPPSAEADADGQSGISVPAASAAVALSPEILWTKESHYIPLDHRPELDRWLASKLESLTLDVTSRLQNVDLHGAAMGLKDFADLLSNWHVRRSRDRFWQSEKDGAKWSAYWTIYETLAKFSVLLAPFTPFYAEELYQSMVRRFWPKDAPLSVHLCAWPERPGRLSNASIDASLECRMDMIREVASLGLAARGSVKLKVRQPLAKAIVVLSDPAAKPSVEALADVARDEINVHALELADRAEDYVSFAVKPHFQRLGPRLGSRMKACAAALAARPAAEWMAELSRDGGIALHLEGEAIRLESEDLDMRISAREGYAAASGRGMVVILDTRLTPELEREGVARELVNRIQGMRKQLDLPYTQRIAVRVGAGGMAARAAVEHAAFIAAETLAEDYEVNDETLEHATEVDLAGARVKLSIRIN